MPSNIETAIQIVNLINATTPGVAQLIIMIKQNDGKVSVLAMLDEADARFKENIEQAKDWLAKHGKK